MSPILLDTIVAIVLILSTLVATFRGFVKEMLTIVNLAGAAAAAYFLGPLLKPSFNGWLGVPKEEGEKTDAIWGVVPPEVMSMFLSYASAFFVVFIVLTLAGLYVSGTIKALGLGPVDRVMGAAFGAARGFLLVLLVYLPFGYFMHPEEYPDWAKHSLSVPLLEKAYVFGNDYLNPEDAVEKIVEEPADPDSLKGRLQNMSRQIKDGDEKTAAPESAAEVPGSYEDADGGLTDEERSAE